MFILFLLLLFGLITLESLRLFSVLDPDFGWHIMLGSKMVESKTLIHNFDGYNIFEKVSVIDHQWLSDILLYLIYNKFGYISLIILFSLISLAAIFIMYRVIIKTASLESGFLVLLIFLLSYSTVFGVRIQVLLYLFCALIFYVKQFFPSFKKRLLAYFMIFLVGNNLHGGGMFALAIIPLLNESELLFNRETRKEGSLRTVPLFLVILSALCLNPNGWDYWKLLYSYFADTSYQSQIAEWLPIYFVPVNWLEYIFPLTLFVFLFTINSYWRKLKTSELLLILVFFFLGIKTRRTFPLFLFVIAPFFALALDDFINLIKAPVKKYRWAVIGFSLILLMRFLILPNYLAVTLNSKPFNNGAYPENATEYIAQNQPNKGNFLNPYDWGGYLAWTHPELKLFIDGRAPIVKVPPTDSMMLVEYNKFFAEDKEEIKRELISYDISYALTQKKECELNLPDKFLIIHVLHYDINKLCPKQNNLEVFLESSPEWKKQYDDSISSVFFKIKE